MYIEEQASKNLMKLNIFYKEKINSSKQKKYRNIFTRLEIIKKLIVDLRKIHHMGIKKYWFKILVACNIYKYMDKTWLVSADFEQELNYTSSKEHTGRIVVYTSIFGGYDRPLEPLYSNPDVDYCIITDQEVDKASKWKKLSCDNIVGFKEMDNYHKSKYCKLNPHVLFPDYEYSIWVDGNVQIVADLVPFVDRLDENHVMGAFMNPAHDCIYTERNFIIFLDAANMDEINRQVNAYEREGFPHMFGMREFSIIVRKHNDKECIGFMEQWWQEVNKYTMRDQISFPYLLWKNGKSMDWIQLLGGHWRDNARVNYVEHKWRHTFKS